VAEINKPEAGATPVVAAVETPPAPQAQRGGGDHRGGGDRGGQRGGGNRGRRKPVDNDNFGGEEMFEKVVFINRSSKVVKGGRRFKFSALVVVGDKKGRAGYALGKASEVADAIKRGGELARNKMQAVALKDATIPHEVYSTFGGAKILLRPASPGTGIIAGKTVRSVLEAAGIKDILTKSLGSKNAANVVKATLGALLSLRTREMIYQARGLEIKKVAAPKAPEAIAA
jgi:small subunit ribosomal protein S5